MTVGIAITLDDGALLIADGRRTLFLAQGTPPPDDADKLSLIAPTITAIALGVAQATDVAVQLLLSNLPSDSNPQQVQQHVIQSVYDGWIDMLGKLSGQGHNIFHPSMRAGLIVAGLAADTPFVTGALIFANPENKNAADHSTTLEIGPYKSMVVGGEQQSSTNFFNELAHREIDRHEELQKSGVPSDLDTALLGSAVATIRMVAVDNPEVGGTIRYACIRRGQLYTMGAV